MTPSLATRIIAEAAIVAEIERASARAVLLRALEILEAERLLCPLATAMLKDIRANPEPP